jgi:hypothetical protein
MQLTTNQTETITVTAAKYPSGDPILSVKQGEVYSFRVEKGQRWTDFYFIGCGPKGFSLPYRRKELHIPNINYFCLCGLLQGHSEIKFPIGESLPDYLIQENGELRFFANDHPDYYSNNRGSIEVKVTRVR